ncbi:hypothetical protein M407DRAFT_111482 [Tulasnella calospora MUT 4182]|uniref:Uncharacterized protein n=1 Tax=Tulasnella calospora MUT 4182 TaxID=1051891 RepID=A0A0C3QSY5_9AGAM|nr:hypothetical protein M407DRAFT_111482 [Tulasnella calospora MUT 4182]
MHLDQLTPAQGIISDGASTAPSDQHPSISKPGPVDPTVPTQPRSRPFEMQALRPNVFQNARPKNIFPKRNAKPVVWRAS